MSQRFRIGADLPRNLVERGIAIPAVLQHAQLPGSSSRRGRG
jgi:hypothetical protein